jgi:glycosyltransferase involved in cell wall biosynthesis
VDDTGACADWLAKGNAKIKAVHFPWNRGYGKTVREGLFRCRRDNCDFAVCLHADGQYPPEVIPRFVQEMAACDIDILQGSRIASGTALSGGMPVYKYAANRILTFFENIAFGLSMTDYHSGMLVYGRKALNSLPFEVLSSSFDFDLEVIALARSRGLRIEELPIPTRYAGEISHVNVCSYGLRVLRVMARYATGRYHRL